MTFAEGQSVSFKAPSALFAKETWLGEVMAGDEQVFKRLENRKHGPVICSSLAEKIEKK